MPRLSKAIFSKGERPDFDSASYSAMFIRNYDAGIIPFRMDGKDPFTVRLSVANQGLEKQLVEFLSIGQYGQYFLNESLQSAIEALSLYLITYGEVYLEIVCKDDTDKIDIGSNKPVFLPWGKVIKLLNRFFQIVPIANWGHQEKKFYILPASRIWHVQLPKQLGTPRAHRRMLKRLARLSVVTPGFVRKNGIYDESARYDFIAQRHYQDIAAESETAKWGGSQGASQIEGTTEYHLVVTRLKSAYSQALIREHLINEINTLIARLGADNALEVEGLVSSATINEAMNKLEKGDIGFSEALDALEE